MLLPPTLGFCMEQYFMFVHKPVHQGESVSAWVAVTLGECKPIKGMGRKRPKYIWPGGRHWHPTWVPWHPTRMPTTHIRWPPSEVHCATHERQHVCSLVPKTQIRRPKNATQGLPKWWRSRDWVDMATVTHVHRVTPNFTDIYPNCSRGRSQNGSGQRLYHHRRGGLIWTRFLLVTGGSLLEF
jgi:hypothetical protein